MYQHSEYNIKLLSHGDIFLQRLVFTIIDPYQFGDVKTGKLVFNFLHSVIERDLYTFSLETTDSFKHPGFVNTKDIYAPAHYMLLQFNEVFAKRLYNFVETGAFIGGSIFERNDSTLQVLEFLAGQDRVQPLLPVECDHLGMHSIDGKKLISPLIFSISNLSTYKLALCPILPASGMGLTSVEAAKKLHDEIMSLYSNDKLLQNKEMEIFKKLINDQSNSNSLRRM